MDLYHHTNPLFTKWIVDNELLEEAFTVMDVGCQGGPHPAGRCLGILLTFTAISSSGWTCPGPSTCYWRLHLIRAFEEERMRIDVSDVA
jgi:hypothetical protein